MTAPSRPSSPETDRPSSSPAVVVTLGAGLAGVLLSLDHGAFPVALFVSAVSLAALPMALADRPGARSVRLALLGGGMAALALVLVLGPLLFSDTQKAERSKNHGRSVSDVPGTPAPAAPSPGG